jgi:hypothetical protein
MPGTAQRLKWHELRIFAWLLSVEIMTKVSITYPIFKFFPLIFINGAYGSVKTPQSIDI